MILVADSGGTKTDWLLGDKSGPLERFQTRGLQPNLISEEEMRRILREEVKPQLLRGEKIHNCYFFGAGLASTTTREKLARIITEELPSTKPLHIDSDLVAAAYAALGNKAGVLAILGTGSVAIRYDGQKIVAQHGGWGFLLGDEGGGIALGRAWLQRYLHGQLTDNVAENYREFLQLKHDQIIERVYQQKPLGSFLAQQCQFLDSFQHESEVATFLENQFAEFLATTLRPCLEDDSEEIVIVGGIAQSFFSLIARLFRHHGLSYVRHFSQPLVVPLFRYLVNHER